MNRFLNTILISSFCTLSSCSYAENKEYSSGNTMNNFNEMKNWCIGRYTFQLPKEVSLVGGSDKYASFKIESELQAKTLDFEEAIEKAKKEYSTQEDFIKDQTPIENNGNTINKIIWGHSTAFKGIPVEVFGFVYDKSNRTLFKIKGIYSQKYEAQSKEAIKSLVKNLVGWDNTKIPNQAGVCIINGFIKDGGQPFRYSNQSVGFNSKTAPSLRIVMQTEATTEELENLVDRTAKNIKKTSFAASVFSSIKTIRKGQKNQNNEHPLLGYEWIISAPMKGRNGIDGKWEHTGTAGDGLDPLIQLEVNSGNSNTQTQTASLSEKEAFYLYEKIFNSIKKF